MAIGEIVGAVTGVANTINSIITGNKIAKKQLQLQENEQKFQQSLGQLSNEQNYVLQSQLNNAKTETERYAILTNAVTQIKLQQQGNTSKSNNQTVIVIVAVMVVAVIALLIIKKDN
ncbi:MAG: hypothetical protein NTZ59_02405 [Bacteroidetes bacterium]|nr:hypothetical protein [Bacteroidota bacterium]